MDLLFRGGRDRSSAVQHHPDPQVCLLLAQVVLRQALWPLAKHEEVVPQDGEGEHVRL